MEETRISLSEAILQFPVVTWCSDYLKVYDNGATNFYCECPVCGKRKLGVDRFKKLFHCFTCDDGGLNQGRWTGRANLIEMICLVERVSKAEAIAKIYSRSGFPDPIVKREIKTPEHLIPRECIGLWKAHATHPAVQMLITRGVEHLIETAYIALDGKYQNRIVMPAYFCDVVTGIEAKAIDKTQRPKSLFPNWFDTANTIYTTSKWSTKDKFCVVTESILDAETFGVNATGLYGSSFKDGHLRCFLDLKRERGVTTLVWCLDNDAWAKQAKMLLSKTLSHFENCVIPLPYKQDPNEIGRDQCWDRLSKAEYIRDELDLLEISMRYEQNL